MSATDGGSSGSDTGIKKYSSTPLDRWDVASVYEALDEWTESHGGVPPKIKECDSHKELPSHMVFEKLLEKQQRVSERLLWRNRICKDWTSWNKMC